jgi:hypothetical protein
MDRIAAVGTDRKLERGDVFELDGQAWEIVSVTPRLTPYRKAGQYTTVEGYTLGLRELARAESAEDRRCAS